MKTDWAKNYKREQISDGIMIVALNKCLINNLDGISKYLSNSFNINEGWDCLKKNIAIFLSQINKNKEKITILNDENITYVFFNATIHSYSDFIGDIYKVLGENKKIIENKKTYILLPIPIYVFVRPLIEHFHYLEEVFHSEMVFLIDCEFTNNTVATKIKEEPWSRGI